MFWDIDFNGLSGDEAHARFFEEAKKIVEGTEFEVSCVRPSQVPAPITVVEDRTSSCIIGQKKKIDASPPGRVRRTIRSTLASVLPKRSSADNMAVCGIFGM